MRCKACYNRTVVLFFDYAYDGRCYDCYRLKKPLKVEKYLD